MVLTHTAMFAVLHIFYNVMRPY